MPPLFASHNSPLMRVDRHLEVLWDTAISIWGNIRVYLVYLLQTLQNHYLNQLHISSLQIEKLTFFFIYKTLHIK